MEILEMAREVIKGKEEFEEFLDRVKEELEELGVPETEIEDVTAELLEEAAKWVEKYEDGDDFAPFGFAAYTAGVLDRYRDVQEINEEVIERLTEEWRRERA